MHEGAKVRKCQGDKRQAVLWYFRTLAHRQATPRRSGVRYWLIACAGLTGCYTYRPITTPDPDPGAHVSASLTQDGAAALVPVLGPEIAEVRGRVVDANPDTVRLSLASVTSQRGIPTSWRGEEVRLPRARLASITERRLAPGGTVMLGGAVMGGLYFVYRLLGGPGLFGSTGGGGGGTGR